jgi:hypothetical protein
VLKTIAALTDVLLGVLAKAAAVIGDIISDPIGWGREEDVGELVIGDADEVAGLRHHEGGAAADQRRRGPDRRTEAAVAAVHAPAVPGDHATVHGLQRDEIGEVPRRIDEVVADAGDEHADVRRVERAPPVADAAVAQEAPEADLQPGRGLRARRRAREAIEVEDHLRRCERLPRERAEHRLARREPPRDGRAEDEDRPLAHRR